MEGLIHWKADLTVYSNFLDDQHKRLFEMVNDLHASFQEGQLPAAGDGAFNDLLGFFRTHFNTEEIMMQATSYPHVGEHISVHTQMLDDMHRIVGELADGSRNLSEGLFMHISKWISDHLRDHDTRFGGHLKTFTEEHPDAPLPF